MKITIVAIVAVLLGCLFAGTPGAWAIPSDQLECQIKAGFIVNFAKYAEWPASSGKDRGPLNICILGKSPLDDALDRLKGRTARSRPLVIRHINAIEELGDCQLLFISASQKTNLRHILSALQGREVLTVSDMKRFAESGGMIGLVSEGEKLSFAINLKEARRGGVKISALLLQLASTVIE